MKTRRIMAVVLGLASVSPLKAGAQALDSISVALDNRYRWRSYDRGDGWTARSAASFAIAGFATSRNAGDPNNWRFDVGAITPLEHRGRRDAFDQYEASLSYGRCLAQCRQGEWNKRVSLNLAANGYALPNAVGKTTTTELEATLRGYAAIQRIGQTQVGANLYPFLTVDRDFNRYRGTFTRAGTGTYLGPFGAFGLSLDAAVAASDWGARNGAARSFGFHGVDAQLGLDHDQSVGDRHLSTRLTWGLEHPDDAIGSSAGVLSLRFKLSGPVFLFN